jgi:hypothetical protein
MGLDERRKLAELTGTVLPACRAEIKDECGADMELELDTDTFKDDATALNFFEYQGAKYLANAVRVIGLDEMGKEALRDSVKKVRWVNLPPDRVAEKSATLVDGMLTITGAWGVGGSDGWIGYDALARDITAQL